MAIEKQAAYRLIDEAKVARLAQLDPEQTVHAIPFVFVRHGDNLYSPVDGKPKRHAKLSRLAWIEHHPEVTVLIDQYTDDWTNLWWLRIYGEAQTVGRNADHWDALTQMLVAKYPQYNDIPMFSGEPTMMRIVIRRWRHWSASN